MSKPIYQMPSDNEPRGNIFCIMGEVSKLLRDNGTPSLADEMCNRVKAQHSYEDTKKVIGEYVDVI